MQFAVSEGSPLARLVPFENDGGVVATGIQMAIEAVDRNIQFAVGKPANAEVGFVEAAFVRAGREALPVEAACLF